jgi:TctA family transporter
MDELSALFHGFAVVLTPMNIGLMFVGITLGVLIGVLPGLGGANGVAILLPLTFTMSPTSAIVMLSCIYWGALFGGAITSVLFNIPGEPWSVATTFDGYPLAQKGKAGEALTAAFTSSFVGAFIAVLMITFLAPLVARFALKFGAPEFFAVYLLTFCSFVGMGKGSPFKVLVSMALGFALATVGMDTVTGQLRMTFGVPDLMRGFDFLIAVIGLFGIGEILLSMEEGLRFSGKSARINAKVVWQTWKQLPRYWMTSLRSSVVGMWMGITPGGATPASFMSYGLAKKMSKTGDKFGTGEVEGVVAPETADLGAATGSAALHRAEGLRVGPDRQHVPGQPGRPDRRADDRAAVRFRAAHPVLDHRAGDHRDLRDWRVHGAPRHARHLVHAAVRRHRLRLQEARLSPGTAGAGLGAGRQGGGLVPPVDADVAGRDRHHVGQPAGGHHHHAGAADAVLAADLEAAGAAAHPEGQAGIRRGATGGLRTAGTRVHRLTDAAAFGPRHSSFKCSTARL